MAFSRTLVRPLVVSLTLWLGVLGFVPSAQAQPGTAVSSAATGSLEADSLEAAPQAASFQIGLQQDAPLRLAKDGPMLALCGSFVALQALDLHSTRLALDAGGREANPVMRALLGGDRLPMVKAAGTGAILLLTERMRRHNRRAALLTMIALDSAYATIVAHNYAIARR